jgi:hypothetical protein
MEDKNQMKKKEGKNRSGVFVLALVIGCLIAGLGILLWDANRTQHDPAKDTPKSSEAPLPHSPSSIFSTETSLSTDPPLPIQK